MSPLPNVIDLDLREEARRLWAGARDAAARAPDDLVALCESLDLGIRSAEILVIERLRPHRDQFPATISIQLETPVPEVDVYRDAINVPNVLQFTDIVDLLSQADLECVAPGLHRGWEDRRFSCHRSRATAREAVGVVLPREQREELLLLSAYRNRIFRYPPPIRIVPGDVLAALPSLAGLVERLLETAS